MGGMCDNARQWHVHSRADPPHQTEARNPQTLNPPALPELRESKPYSVSAKTLKPKTSLLHCSRNLSGP